MPYRPAHKPPLERLFARMRTAAWQTLDTELAAFAKTQLNSFKYRIYRQLFPDFENIPLSPRYLAWKLERGLDGRTMIRVGHYVRALKVQSRERNTQQGRTKTYHIGFDQNALAVNAQGDPIPLLLNALARIQEYGSLSAGIPARRHWRPMLAIIRERSPALRRRVRKTTIQRLRREFTGF